MARLAWMALIICGMVLIAARPAAADWWPFGKDDKKTQKPASKKVSANTPIKPATTTTPKKSSSWFASEKPKSSGYVSPYSGVGSSNGKKTAEKKGWFSSLFQKEEPPKKLNSVDDFMSLERPAP